METFWNAVGFAGRAETVRRVGLSAHGDADDRVIVLMQLAIAAGLSPTMVVIGQPNGGYGVGLRVDSHTMVVEAHT